MPNNTTENTPTADPIRELLEQILKRLDRIEAIITISDQEQRAKLDLILGKRGSRTLLEDRELRLREERLARER